MTTLDWDWPEAELLEFISERVATTPDDLQPCVAGGIVRDGELVGSVVYNNFHELDHGSWCEISVATKDRHCGTNTVLSAMFHYPFRQLGVNRLQACTAWNNRPANRMLAWMGFVLEGRLRRAYDGREDIAMYSMQPEQCRWLVRPVVQSAHGLGQEANTT